MEDERRLRVEPHGGNWVIRDGDLAPPLATFPTAEEAERHAQDLAVRLDSHVEVRDDRRWAPEEATKGGGGRGGQVDTTHA